MIGVAPLLALIIYLYFRKRRDRDFSQLLVYGFIAGSAGVLVLVLAEFLSMQMGLSNLRSLNRILFYSFITIGGSSELGKFIIFRYFIIPKKQIVRPIDAITFSIIASLGFSSIAILLIIFNFFDIQSHFPVTLYSSVFVPANIIFSVIMGFFVGMAKFMKTRFVFSLTGLFGAVFFHGIFNLCLLTSDFKLLSLFSFGSTLIVLVLGLKAAFSNPEPSDQ
jgi:protease PrsW